jgi:alginate O-acetyltransferase complex protein AlgI
MVFSDITFLAFFALYFPIHLFLPPQWRIYLVIVGSAVFYSWWRIDYFWLPFALALFAWAGVEWMMRTDDPAARRWRCVVVLVILFLPLAAFKYSYFFVHDVLGALPFVSLGDVSWLKVALPLAISFVTFTLTAYIVDVYRGRYSAERRLSIVLGYVLFFPHLIAGPILRPNELMPQLKQLRPALDARFTLGVALFALGLIKKLVFADTLAGPVEAIFKPGADPNAWEYLLGIYGYSVQIYCDFSGYTDMAIGLAYLLRIRLPTNFLRPYTATSFIDFWRKWHITLSHWLRDYLYIPLGGNRHGKTRQLVNIMITMGLGGLWHGANWTFVIWGLIHGAGLGITHALRGPLRKAGIVIPTALSIFVTFNLVTFAWVYFRAPDLATAHRVLAGPFTASWPPLTDFAQKYAFEIALLALFLLTHRFDRHARVRLAVQRWNAGLVWALVSLSFMLAITVSQGSSAKFIYFDF